MYWEPWLNCPHCREPLTQPPDEPYDVWRETKCEHCGEPFKFQTESVTRYTTMTPALEAVRRDCASRTRRILEASE